MRSSHRRLAAGLLLVPLLSGCFSSPSDPSGSGQSGRLRVVLAFPPTQNYSPYGQDAYSLSRLGVTEGLTRLDTTGVAVSALAESWTSAQDGRSWVFTLRKAKFQDGTDLTAAAAAAALTSAAQAKPQLTALSGVLLSAEPVGANQVRITTSVPDPVLPQRLSNPSLAVLSPKAYEKKEAVNPVGTGTGPFRITQTTGATQATLERFGDYWGGLAQVPGIDVKFIADGTARANALRSGEADIAEAIPVSQAGSLDKDRVNEMPTARLTSLHLNTTAGPFTNPALRAAARAAIDTSVLARDVFEGHADPGQGLFGPALSWAAGKRTAPARQVQPANAQGTTITLATYDNRPELPETAQVLQQQLQRAGFTVKLEVRESSRLLTDALAGKFDAFVGSRNMMLDTGDPVSVLASDFTCQGTYNMSRLCDKPVDEAVTKAEAVTDPGQRQSAAMAVEAAILSTDAVIPLVHQKAIVGVGPSVQQVLFDPYERMFVGTGTRR
ncbi:peptide/nickel transport system substrate-binding protein [Kibdelosporangium banguiense]|uniref:Peptide/nickel transport system substrate-binding protein n=1 Tax=Kibdelosporangium banguiense TaxID=1365924 RepID=A0ABS4TVJ0_9PSEU|nr:ABC transporter substrate-binding protein [Kibdelosporangium banguiense]MBP2327999.1 peptide/nickel transport system substrate-binding protein [Kibdelosporangium banguiense]